MKKNIFLKFVLLFSVLILSTYVGNCQAPDTPDDPDVPIDGGISLLVAAGVGYGAKKIKDRKKVILDNTGLK